MNPIDSRWRLVGFGLTALGLAALLVPMVYFVVALFALLP